MRAALKKRSLASTYEAMPCRAAVRRVLRALRLRDNAARQGTVVLGTTRRRPVVGTHVDRTATRGSPWCEYGQGKHALNDGMRSSMCSPTCKIMAPGCDPLLLQTFPSLRCSRARVERRDLGLQARHCRATWHRLACSTAMRASSAASRGSGPRCTGSQCGSSTRCSTCTRHGMAQSMWRQQSEPRECWHAQPSALASRPRLWRPAGRTRQRGNHQAQADQACARRPLRRWIGSSACIVQTRGGAEHEAAHAPGGEAGCDGVHAAVVLEHLAEAWPGWD